MAFNLFMHERNIYKNRPDFKQIAKDYPEFRKYAVPDEKGRIHVDFNDQNTLRMLTRILLKKDFNLNVVIPDGFLIPTIPQRLNYLLWVEDLLGVLPKRSCAKFGIDIGTGPCAIFSLLGTKKNNWNFVATETSDEAIKWAEKNIKTNNLDSLIKVTKVNKDSILEEVLTESETVYDFCLCNPPFFENVDEIKKRSSRAKESLATTAKKDEILAEGGEVTFVKNMIGESVVFKNRVCLYTSMFGRKKSYIQVLKELQNIEGVSYTKTEFCQGNTIRWGIAWTFLDSVNFQSVEQIKPKKKPKKAKPPLLHTIPKTNEKFSTVQKLAAWMQNLFTELEIQFKVSKSAENFSEIHIATNINTWSHQRRKRREVSKEKVTKNGLTCSASDTIEMQASKDSPVSSNNETDNMHPLDTDNTEQILSLKDLATVDNQEVFVKDCNLENSHEHLEDTLTLQDSACLEPVIVSGKRKVRDEDSFPNPPSQKFQTEGSSKKGTTCLTQDVSYKKRKRDGNDGSLDNSKSKTLKLDDTLDSEVMKPVSDSEINPNSEVLDSNSLLFCVTKIRKGEDHLLLEINCPPESNRESMHQVFQFLKNKLTD